MKQITDKFFRGVSLQVFTIFFVFLLFVQETKASPLSEETHKLDGKEITYEYTSGRSYHVKFTPKGISYQYLTGTSPSSWWGAFPYIAFEVYPNVYMASWYEKGYGDHVTLLIDFNQKVLYGSALLVTKEKNILHFHGAKIKKIEGTKDETNK